MKITILGLVLFLALSAPVGDAQGQQFFDFFGQALVPDTAGQSLTMVGVLADAPPAATPLALDFANFEYTVVIDGLILDVAGNPQVYSGGTVTIYEDAATAADYAVPGSFSDGVALLSGNVTLLTRSLLLATIGSVSGSVDWTGGSRIDEIAPPDRLAWALLAGTNASAVSTEPGYDEAWDGKLEPQEPIVGTDGRSWGGLKLRFGS